VNTEWSWQQPNESGSHQRRCIGRCTRAATAVSQYVCSSNHAVREQKAADVSTKRTVPAARHNRVTLDRLTCAVHPSVVNWTFTLPAHCSGTATFGSNTTAAPYMGGRRGQGSGGGVSRVVWRCADHSSRTKRCDGEEGAKRESARARA
jgi:hypothetical protein